MNTTTTTYTITSIKHTETFRGTLDEAIERARAIDAEYQPAYGVTVSSADDGVTYCTIIDGVAE